MKSTRLNLYLGLFLFLAFVSLNSSLKGQILKNVTDPIKKAGNTVTDPIKDTRQSVKSISEPVRDMRNVKRDVTQPVTDVKREVDGLQSDVDRVESDVQGLKNDVSKTRSSVRNRSGSTSGNSAAGSGTADATQADKARADSVYKSRMRTGTKVRSDKPAPTTTTRTMRTVETDQTISDSRTVLLPPNTIKSRPRQPDYAYNQVGESRPASMRPGYLDSPAKAAIDRTEFDIETLDELFEAAIWTGPDSVHTARSIDYMLDELRTDINDIKRRDRNWDTILYEDKYRKWRALYRRNTDPESIFE